ncbi:helix-turn-helix domain-containing protein [Gordonia sp. (in: high G+C Gram-positive bacteria)]|uniref:helix-turn-helix domain-containing protein n=1 Tax=Gordonia sp. (in: high G+C Gram-positive bacteria) TaxID=84139 RepID=UPI003F9C03E1
MTLLLREAIGDQLRRVRTDQGRTLREVSTDARVSLGYLSEVERGQKEASSELLASICVALEVEIGDVLRDVAGVMTPVSMVSPSDGVVEVIASQADGAAALAAA